MIKMFPHTFNGDQIRLEFGYDEEMQAFISVVGHLKDRVEKNGAEREKEIEDFVFETTLQMDVARDFNDQIRQVVGLRTFNICGKDSCTIIPLPEKQ